MSASSCLQGGRGGPISFLLLSVCLTFIIIISLKKRHLYIYIYSSTLGGGSGGDSGVDDSLCHTVADRERGSRLSK